MVISIAFTPDLTDWGTLLGPLGTLMSPLASAEVWDPLPQLLYCTMACSQYAATDTPHLPTGWEPAFDNKSLSKCLLTATS